jgi:hypothetical protein
MKQSVYLQIEQLEGRRTPHAARQAYHSWSILLNGMIYQYVWETVVFHNKAKADLGSDSL